LEKVKQKVNLRIKPILCSWADFNELYAKIYGPEERKIKQAQEELAVEPEKPVEEPPPKPEEQQQKRHEGLIERFTFETFVVAEVNSFTYALAKSIAESPGSEYNPFFIYGNTGLGKTHLSNAIGNEVVRNNHHKRVVYAPASRFIDEMLDAIEHEKMKEFRERYSTVDLLIVDDIQFLSGRTRAQEEFFNIFNAIYNGKKQIVLVSDVPPKKLAGLEKRLISRFEGGVVACMEEPDFQTRLTILRQRTEEGGVGVPEDVLSLLAQSIPSNVRELEGALKKLLAYSSLVGHEISVELAQEILKHLFKATAS
jgi:chromosomal replication initiator protein